MLNRDTKNIPTPKVPIISIKRSTKNTEKSFNQDTSWCLVFCKAVTLKKEKATKKTNYSSTTLTNQASKFFDPPKRCKYVFCGPNRRLQSTRTNFLMRERTWKYIPGAILDFRRNVKIVKNGPKMTRSSKRFLITGNSQPQMKTSANDSEWSCATKKQCWANACR